MKTIFLFFLLLTTACFQLAFSQSNSNVDPNFKEHFKTIEIQEWSSERFILARKSPSSQKYGYQSIRKMGDVYRYKSLSYANYVGKVVKVIGVRTSDFSRESYYVSLVVEETGERLEATANIDMASPEFWGFSEEEAEEKARKYIQDWLEKSEI